MRFLAEHEVKAWIRGFGIAVPRAGTAPDPRAVEPVASALTPPLVVKAYGPGLVHKSEAGAVRLDLATGAAAAEAAREMLETLAGHGITPDGFLVEEQAEAGVEMIVGTVLDPAFGPVLLAGLGGVWTEVLRDTVLRLCPVTEADARSMLRELRGAALLDGSRGRPPVDRDALVRVLLAVGGPGGVAERLGEAPAEFELNPVVCGPGGAIAVDARLTGLREPPPARGEPVNPGRRPAPRRRDDFDRLFAPRGIAVVGASATRPNFGNMFLGFYRASGVPGTLVAVHPTAAEIDGVPCVRSLAEVPRETDYALVAVPAERCPGVVRRAAGIPYVQVMSGGFREAGRADLESDLVAAAREAGVRLLGPNCMGVYSPAGGQTFLGGEPGRPGRIAVASQSGGMAGEVVKVGERRGLAFSKVATVGNSADVTPAELLRHFSGDPGTSAVGLYLEDPRDGRGLFEALQATAKPVVALIGGLSGQGRHAAASHTGGMVSDARVWDALGAQTGVSVVTSQDDLLGVLHFFDLHACRAAPGDAGVLVIGPSGGAGVLAADVFDAAGLDLTPLPEGTLAPLRELGLGTGGVLANPLETPVGPRADPATVRRAVTAVLGHRPYADVVAHVNVQSFVSYGGTGTGALPAYAHAVGALQEEYGDVRVTLVTRNAECAPTEVESDVRSIARAAGVPVYRTMEAAAVAVAAGRRWQASRRTAGGTDRQE
ncbi:acetate--CoA ligase family protein [Actinomadura alba]|uniref:Acetate--CoA ligase family protein n=1 Tax=Actinomadura alba TaxID=406431 RepID=A0ABR7LH35_9ACTN|nr:acetate--CoA ligase family protein [Actinomadura alba]